MPAKAFLGLYFLLMPALVSANWENQTYEDPITDAVSHTIVTVHRENRIRTRAFSLNCRMADKGENRVLIYINVGQYINQGRNLIVRVDDEEPIAIHLQGSKKIESTASGNLAKGFIIDSAFYERRHDEEDLSILIDQFKAGTAAAVRVTSEGETIDFPISLIGFTRAYNRLSEDCGW